MKLAIIRTSIQPIDMQSYNVQEIGLAKGLLNFGVSTDFYSKFDNVFQSQTLLNDNGNTIKLIPIKGKTFFGKLTYFSGLPEVILKGNYDAVQVLEDSQLMTPLILKKCHLSGVKTVLYQGLYQRYKGKKSLWQYFMDFVFKNTIRKNTDVFFAKTEFAKKYLENKGYKNISVIPVGLSEIENKPTQVVNEINDFKSKFSHLLLYVGKIEERRNPFFLVDLLSQMETNIGLVIVGKGPLKEQMNNYALQKNLTDRILSIEFIPNDELHEVYKSCDVFLLPTNNEIYGMTILEALLNGVPVISTFEAGPRSILNNEKLGICLPLNVSEWLDAIKYYIEEMTLNSLSLYRQNTVKETYNWNKIAIDYYKKITQ